MIKTIGIEMAASWWKSRSTTWPQKWVRNQNQHRAMLLWKQLHRCDEVAAAAAAASHEEVSGSIAITLSLCAHCVCACGGIELLLFIEHRGFGRKGKSGTCMSEWVSSDSTDVFTGIVTWGMRNCHLPSPLPDVHWMSSLRGHSWCLSALH